jgi:hypothetical protein
MTIDEFHEMIREMAMARTSLGAYRDYILHRGRENKYLHEEYLAIQAVVRFKGYAGDAQIELGDEKEEWDARIDGVDLFDVVQALPAEEHIVRAAVAGGHVQLMGPVFEPDDDEPEEMPITGPLARFLVQAEHANDHFQFPDVIVQAINNKHAKMFADKRALIVAFDGDYSGEDDRVIRRWIDEVRQHTNRGNFTEIFLVEVARQKVFPIF